MSTDGFRIELPHGGLQIHDLSLGDPAPDAPVVVAVHGITANGLSWLCVAEELGRRRGSDAVRFLAPDLRGRAGSRDAPGPYGIGSHADDVLGTVGAFGARPVLVGHSMGAFVAAVAAARAPDRIAATVLVDGGLAFPTPPDLDVDAALQAVIGPAMARLSMRFAGPEAYLDFWADHPAVGPLLRGSRAPEVRRYLLSDLVPAQDDPDSWVSSCVLEAIRADGADTLGGSETHAAAAKAVASGMPMELVWAQRGLMNEEQGLYDDQRLALLDLPDALRVTAVRDVNHYSVVFDPAGVGVVVDAVERALDG